MPHALQKVRAVIAWLLSSINILIDMTRLRASWHQNLLLLSILIMLLLLLLSSGTLEQLLCL